MSRTNNDGLYIRLGTDEAKLSKVGEYRSNGPRRYLEIDARYQNMPAVADGNVVVSEFTKIPKNAYIEAVEVQFSTDLDSTSDDITIDVGIKDVDGGNTFTDTDGLIAAMTQTEANTGGTNVAGWVGAKVGVQVTEEVYITWGVANHAASAGVGVIRVWYSIPDKTEDTLGT